MPTLEPLPYHKRGINSRRKMFIHMLTDNLAHTISHNSCLVYAGKSWFVGDPLASKFTRKKNLIKVMNAIPQFCVLLKNETGLYTSEHDSVTVIPVCLLLKI